MALSTSKQPMSGKRDHYSSFHKSPRKQIMETLRSKTPSEDLRERRRRCFIASSYSKNCGDQLALDPSKSKHFTLAMKEEEEIEFFESLWKNLPVMLDDDATTVPPVADESTRPSESDCGGPAGQTLNNQQSTIKQVSVVTTKNPGDNFEATNITSDGHNGDNNGVKTETIILESPTEKNYFSEIEAKRNSVCCQPERNASKHGSFCNISDARNSRGETRRLKHSSEVHPDVQRRPLDANVSDDDSNRRVFLNISPREKPNHSQTGLYLEEMVSPRRLSQEICQMGLVQTRNKYTQTYPVRKYYNRYDSDQSPGGMETKRRPLRNWYRHNNNGYEKRGNRGFFTHRRSPSCHRDQQSSFEPPKMSYAGRRFQKDHQSREFFQNGRRFNPRPYREYSRRRRSFHVEDDTDEVDRDNFSRHWRTNDASDRECSCSSNSESAIQMPQHARNVARTSYDKPRRPVDKEASRASSRASSSCRCQGGDVTTPRDLEAPASSRGNEMRVVAPRRVLVCPLCGVIVSSKKSMAAHMNGARHSRIAGDAERQGDHNNNNFISNNNNNYNNNNNNNNNNNKVLACRMAYIPQPLMPVLEYVLVKKVGKHI